MFRPMRRKNQALPLKECEEILMEGKSGVLALSGGRSPELVMSIIITMA